MLCNVLFRGPCLSLAVALGLAIAGCDGGSGGQGGSGGTGDTGGAGGAMTGGGGAGGSGGQGGSGGTGGVAVQTGDFAFTVVYEGAQTGTLTVAAFTSFPPAGPPEAFQVYDMPVFPQMGKLVELDPGTDYYVLAVLDVGSNNPQMPGPEDPYTATMPPVQVTAGTETPIELTLTDP